MEDKNPVVVRSYSIVMLIQLTALCYGKEMPGEIFYENVLSLNGHAFTERLPCAERTKREEETADVSHQASQKLIEKNNNHHPTASISKP